MREEVTEEDAKEVVDIMKFSMIDTYIDEFGFLDFRRSQHGSGMSNRSQVSCSSYVNLTFGFFF